MKPPGSATAACGKLPRADTVNYPKTKFMVIGARVCGKKECPHLDFPLLNLFS